MNATHCGSCGGPYQSCGENCSYCGVIILSRAKTSASPEKTNYLQIHSRPVSYDPKGEASARGLTMESPFVVEMIMQKRRMESMLLTGVCA